jgi:hypothetical protein
MRGREPLEGFLALLESNGNNYGPIRFNVNDARLYPAVPVTSSGTTVIISPVTKSV